MEVGFIDKFLGTKGRGSTLDDSFGPAVAAGMWEARHMEQLDRCVMFNLLMSLDSLSVRNLCSFW